LKKIDRENNIPKEKKFLIIIKKQKKITLEKINFLSEFELE